jgi:membrane protein
MLARHTFHWSPSFIFYFNTSLNFIFSVIIVMLWFVIVLRFLADGRPEWKVAWTGAFLTSFLFNIGKFILRGLLTYSNVQTVYGPSGSIVLLLLFVFYSALILYYGAAFTKIWGAYHNMPIRPLPHASHYKVTDDDV